MVGLEVHQAAQGAQALGLVVDELGVLLERGVAAAASGELELGDRERLKRWFSRPPGTGRCRPRRAACGRSAAWAGTRVLTHPHLAGDDVDADAADPRGRPGEALVNEVLIEPQRLEDLGAVVALDRADPHLGDDLDDPLGDRLAVLLLGQLGRAEIIPSRTWSWTVSNARYGSPRSRHIQQQGEVVNLARLAGFQDESDLRPRPGPDQVVVDRRDRQQSWDRASSASWPRSDRMMMLWLRRSPPSSGRGVVRSPGAARRRRRLPGRGSAE